MSVPAPKAPFPYFGGKSAVAAEVWARFGNICHLVDACTGSAAIPLARPDGTAEIMTLNDMDGLLTNFWRAAADDPDGLAELCDWPVNELDLHARRRVLHERGGEITERLRTDPDFYELEMAAWWVWGLSQWIGHGFISEAGLRETRQKPHLGSTGTGVFRLPGKFRQKPHLGGAGKGIFREPGISRERFLKSYFADIRTALSGARICCGDWRRVVTPAALFCRNDTRPVGVFLDPPYAGEGRDTVYRHDCTEIARDSAAWAVEAADRYPRLRIALCDYADTHDMPGWTVFRWKAQGGMSNQSGCNLNRHRETIWFSPSCLAGNHQMELFGEEGVDKQDFPCYGAQACMQ